VGAGYSARDCRQGTIVLSLPLEPVVHHINDMCCAIPLSEQASARFEFGGFAVSVARNVAIKIFEEGF
jgi:hypothetical protein